MSNNAEQKLTAVVTWLQENQPDVFRRGLWEAIGQANAAPQPVPTPTDTERLNWLERNGAELHVEWDDGEAPLPWPEFFVRVKGTGGFSRCKSHRAAIDAAIIGREEGAS